MSEEQKQRNMRTYFYIFFFVILISQFLLYSFYYLTNLKKDYSLISKQLFDNILKQKEDQLRLVVNEKINEINELDHSLRTQLLKEAENLSHIISYEIETEGPDIFLKGPIKWFPSKDWSYSIRDKVSQKVYTEAHDTEENGVEMNLDPVVFLSEASSRFEVKVYVPPRRLSAIFLSGVRSIIDATIQHQVGYVWINHILNYRGGDDYAIRLFHPNLPETEGSLLSTKTEDIKGNLPYLNELNGINAHGEVIHEYFFKEMDSDLIIRKLSYGKLLKKHDWVVATGLNLDDVDLNIEAEQERLDKSFRSNLLSFAITFTVSLLLSLILIVLFEKRVSRLILTYIKESKEEKQKLADAFEKMKEMAYVDNLTGLLNRRAMIEVLENEIARVKRGNPGFCIILSDLDKFKKINDTHGHNTGDYVLRETARIFGSILRKEDLISRWGGEEFLFLIPNSTLDKGLQIAEKIRKTIEEHQFQDNGEPIPVTMTLGVCNSSEGLDLKNLIHDADQKMYEGKRSTRNCVVG